MVQIPCQEAGHGVVFLPTGCLLLDVACARCSWALDVFRSQPLLTGHVGAAAQEQQGGVAGNERSDCDDDSEGEGEEGEEQESPLPDPEVEGVAANGPAALQVSPFREELEGYTYKLLPTEAGTQLHALVQGLLAVLSACTNWPQLKAGTDTIDDEQRPLLRTLARRAQRGRLSPAVMSCIQLSGVSWALWAVSGGSWAAEAWSPHSGCCRYCAMRGMC